MIKDKLHEEKVWSLRELVEKEATMAVPCKTKKKKTKGKDETGPSKLLAQDNIISLVTKSKGGTKASVGLSAKRTPMVSKKKQEEKKFPNWMKNWCMWTCIRQKSLVGMVILC